MSAPTCRAPTRITGITTTRKEIELHDKLLHESDPQKQHALMVEFQKQVMDTEAHATKVIWWNRIVPHRSYVKGWKISPSHFLNQDLATVWLDK